MALGRGLRDKSPAIDHRTLDWPIDANYESESPILLV
jgi:hypothetical protein